MNADPFGPIAPAMPVEEAVRRLLAVFVDENGLPKAGAPGGSFGSQLKSYRVAASNPAVILVEARERRRYARIRNTDAALTAYYGMSQGTDDNALNGAILKPNEVIELPYNGAIYVFATAGAPLIEAVEVY